MRDILPAFAVFALAACASEEPVSDTENIVVEDEGVSDDMSIAGMTFEVEDEPGVDRTVFSTDGTFTDFYEGKVTRTGTYDQPADDELCFTYMGGENVMPEKTTECWTMEGEPDADGWATSVRASDGLRIRARPVFE